MNILITGASGFVGTNLSRHLSGCGYFLESLDLGQPITSEYHAAHKWDDLSEMDLNSFDAIIHLAGKAHDTRNRTDVKSYFDINTGLTQRIFDKFMESDTRKFIFFSSVKAAAEKVSGDSLNEDVIPSPVGPYGESKYQAEKYILDKLAEPGERKQGKNVYILRPSMIHGPGNKGNLNLLYNIVSKGFPWPLGSFDNKRSFTSIANLNFIIEKLITKKIESGIYNICDDDALSTNKLIELISLASGKSGHILKINRGVMRFIARLGDLFHLPFNSFRLQKLTENYIVSNHKIKRAIKIERLPVSSVEGMSETLISFRTYKGI